MSISRNKFFLAISKRQKIKVDYIDSEGTRTQRVIHPYHIFTWKNRIYFIGYCEYDQEIRNFRIGRVKHFEMLNYSFKEKIPSFSYYKSNGYFNFFDERAIVRKLYPAEKYRAKGNNKDNCPLPRPKIVHKYETTFIKPEFNKENLQDDCYPIRYSESKLCNKGSFCRSPIEEKVLNNLEMDSNVKRYWIEPIKIPYILCNKEHTYTPDILVEYNSRKRLLVEVKSLYEINFDIYIQKYKVAHNYCYEQHNLDFQVWTIDDEIINKYNLQQVLNLKFKNTKVVEVDNFYEYTYLKRIVNFFKRIIN